MGKQVERELTDIVSIQWRATVATKDDLYVSSIAAAILLAISLITHNASANHVRPMPLPNELNSHHDTVLTVMFCEGFMGDTATLMIDTHLVSKFTLHTDPTLDFTGVEILIIEHPLKGLYSIKVPGNYDDTQLYRKGKTISIVVSTLQVSIELNSSLPKVCLVGKYPDRMVLDMRAHKPFFE